MNNNTVALAMAIREMVEKMPALLQNIELSAKVRRHYFLKLVAEGFTEAQAMEIVREMKGMIP